MPVIRGRSKELKASEARRRSLLDRLLAERAGNSPPGGPVLFEIPLDQPEKLDVMVVWDEWEGVRSEERTQLIQEAYRDQAENLALALGVTWKEAIEQGVLPFRVRMRFTAQPRFPKEKVRTAYLSVGGFAGPGDTVELRFPTRATAEEAIRQLKKQLPGIQWVVDYATE